MSQDPSMEGVDVSYRLYVVLKKQLREAESALRGLKEQNDDQKKQMQDQRETIKTITAKMRALEEDIEMSVDKYGQTVATLEGKNAELEDQNRVLTDRLEKTTAMLRSSDSVQKELKESVTDLEDQNKTLRLQNAEQHPHMNNQHQKKQIIREKKKSLDRTRPQLKNQAQKLLNQRNRLIDQMYVRVDGCLVPLGFSFQRADAIRRLNCVLARDYPTLDYESVDQYLERLKTSDSIRNKVPRDMESLFTFQGLYGIRLK